MGVPARCSNRGQHIAVGERRLSVPRSRRGSHTGRRKAVATAAPVLRLNRVQRRHRRRSRSRPTRADAACSPSSRSRAPPKRRSRRSSSQEGHRPRTRGEKRAKLDSSTSSSFFSSSSSSLSSRSRGSRHRRHHRRCRRSSSLEEFFVSPLPTCVITLSKHLVRRIKKGKFTNFNCLLGPGNEEGWGALQLQGKRKGEKKASKQWVGDLASWMEAWNVYLAIRVQSATHLAQQHIKYQAIITQLFLHTQRTCA